MGRKRDITQLWPSQDKQPPGDSITWEDPAGKGALRSRYEKAWEAEADALRAQPGRWGIVTVKDPAAGIIAGHGTSGYVMATNIRNGRLAAFRPAGTFEATGRRQADGTVKVYARYVGESRESAVGWPEEKS